MMNKIVRFASRIFSKPEISDISRWAMLGAIVGLLVACAALAFNYLLDFVQFLTIERMAGFAPPLPHGEKGLEPTTEHVRLWTLALLPALGGLLCGLLTKIAPEVGGGGIDQAITSFHHQRGILRKRVWWMKILASSITIGTGGSAGREGPMGQTGAGIGSIFATLLKLRDRDRRVLLLCGIAAGIGAAFKTPLGGALFAAEILYRDPEFEFEALIPCFVASIISYSFFCPVAGVGWGSIFVVPTQVFNNPLQLLFYAALAVVVVGLGIFHVWVFFGISRLFERLPVRGWLKPALGGLALGALALVFIGIVRAVEGPAVARDFTGGILGMGYGYVQWAIDGKVGLGIFLMLLMAVMKILATALTIGSGGSGGAFAPSLVIGGLAGGALGHIFSAEFPSIIPPEQIPAFVLVGMAGFFTSVSKTPLAALFMVLEMTYGYGLLVPLMLVVALSYILTPRHVTNYPTQLPGRVNSPAHTGDFIVDVLEGLRVKDVMGKAPFMTIREETMLPSVLEQVAHSRQSTFPVVSKENELVGILLLNDIRSAFLDRDDLTSGLVIARDLAVVSYDPIVADESLNTALRKFIQSSLDELPVVAEPDQKIVVGMLARYDLMTAYNVQMHERLQSRVLKKST